VLVFEFLMILDAAGKLLACYGYAILSSLVYIPCKALLSLISSLALARPKLPQFHQSYPTNLAAAQPPYQFITNQTPCL